MAGWGRCCPAPYCERSGTGCGDDREMNPGGYWVPGVPEPIQRETERTPYESQVPSSRSTHGGAAVKWIGRSMLVVMSTIAIVATGAASAGAACQVLDPACVIEETVDEGVGLVDDTVDGIGTPVDDVLDPVEGVVDPVVDTILGTVDDVIRGGRGEQPEPPGGTGNGGGDRPGGHRGELEPSGASDRGLVDSAPRVPERPGIGRVFAPVVPHPVADATGSPVEGTGRVGAAIGAVARSLAIVLALFGSTLAFAAIQDRLDRNDPRLSLAPVRSDVVTFA